MFNKVSKPKLVSTSRANLNNTNLGRKSVDEVRNEMKSLKNNNQNKFDTSKVKIRPTAKNIVKALQSKDIDANYFQHIPYLESFNEEKGTHLVNAGGIHYEPFGIYPGQKASLSDIADGDVIAIPNDTTNEARALLLLQDNGLLTLASDAGLTATINDIIDNPYNLTFQELAAEQVARVKDEVAYVVLNGNYALQAGFSVGKDAIAYELSDSEAAKTYVNVIAVKEGNENDAKIKALVEVLKSDEIKEYIKNTYDGSVIPFE